MVLGLVVLDVDSRLAVDHLMPLVMNKFGGFRTRVGD